MHITWDVRVIECLNSYGGSIYMMCRDNPVRPCAI